MNLVVHAMQSKTEIVMVTRRMPTQFWVDYAITHNLTPFISMQNHYNLIYREEEREMFPTLKVNLASAGW